MHLRHAKCCNTCTVVVEATTPLVYAIETLYCSSRPCINACEPVVQRSTQCPLSCPGGGGGGTQACQLDQVLTLALPCPQCALAALVLSGKA